MLALTNALVRTENLARKKRVIEDLLELFKKEEREITKDVHLLNSMCEYVMRSGEAFVGEEKKALKLKILMLRKMSKDETITTIIFQNFYKLFSSSHAWILTEHDKKFAICATLAHASQANSLSVYDVRGCR